FFPHRRASAPPLHSFPTRRSSDLHPLAGLDGSQPVIYRFRVGAGSATPSSFTVSEHGSTLFSTYIPATYTDGLLYYYTSQFVNRSEEHRLNSSHVSISYAVFCLKK